MNQKAKSLLIAGILLVIVGFALSEYADYQKGELGGWYTFAPPYSNSKERDIAYMMKASGWGEGLGAIAVIIGGVWLALPALQKRNDDNSVDFQRTTIRSNYQCPNCQAVIPDQSNFCAECGQRVLQ